MILNMKLLKLDYKMNKYSGPKQIRQIAKQWNINDFDFFMDLIVSIFSICLIDIDICFFCRIGFLIKVWKT